MNTHLRNDRFAAFLVASTYALLVVGASVRVHGAGLACPDWPLCFGQVIPPIDFSVGLEFGHRVLAALLSLGFVALCVGVLRSPAGASPTVKGLLATAAVVLIVQVILGGLTVLHLLAEWSVVSHLVAGNTFCVLLFWIWRHLAEGERPVLRDAVSGGQRVVAIVAMVAVLLQLVLGGLVSSSYAGLACTTWPSCNGGAWFPTFEGLIGLQVMHRIMAYTLFVAAAITLVMCRTRPRLKRPAHALVGLVVVQAIVGIGNVAMKLPVEMTLLHTAGAAACWLAAGWLVYEAWRAPVSSEAL